MRLRRRRRIVLAVGLLLVVGLGGPLAVGEMLIRPANRPVGPPPVDLPARDVALPAAEGGTVRGWLLPGEPQAPGVLLLHGLHSDRRSMLPRARLLHRLGYTVLLIDLHAHGESTGEHITFGASESRDVLVAAAYLRQAVRGRPIAAIGVSLGGAAVVLAGPEVGFSAVVLESVYSTFDDALDNRMRSVLGPPGPLLSGLLSAQLPLREGITAGELRPVDRIREFRVPLLFVQGETDRNATLAQAERLFAAAPGPDKQLWVVPGAGHVDLYQFASQEYRDRVPAFLASRLASRSGSGWGSRSS